MDNEFLSTKNRKLGSQRHLDLVTQTKSFFLYKNNYSVYLFFANFTISWWFYTPS